MNPLSILLVEDDALIGPLLVEILAGLGYKTVGLQTTEDGAVAEVARSKPDLYDLRRHAGQR